MPWGNSDVSFEDLYLGAEEVKRAGIRIEKTRVTGGEPLRHPDFIECMKIICDKWRGDFVLEGEHRIQHKIPVFTTVEDRPAPPRGTWRYRPSPSEPTERDFQPPMVSPLDLGMEPIVGVEIECERQYGCGRLFDAHGFHFCIYAGAIGRVLGVDHYSAKPILKGTKDICGHCPYSQGVRGANKLWRKVTVGHVEYPTKSYREGVERCKSEGPPSIPKFQERM
jgi:hypothetical protein